MFDTSQHIHVPLQRGKYTVVFQASCFGWVSLREVAVGAVSSQSMLETLIGICSCSRCAHHLVLVQVQLERQKHWGAHLNAHPKSCCWRSKCHLTRALVVESSMSSLMEAASRATCNMYMLQAELLKLFSSSFPRVVMRVASGTAKRKVGKCMFVQHVFHSRKLEVPIVGWIHQYTNLMGFMIWPNSRNRKRNTHSRPNGYEPLHDWWHLGMISLFIWVCNMAGRWLNPWNASESHHVFVPGKNVRGISVSQFGSSVATQVCNGTTWNSTGHSGANLHKSWRIFV